MKNWAKSGWSFVSPKTHASRFLLDCVLIAYVATLRDVYLASRTSPIRLLLYSIGGALTKVLIDRYRHAPGATGKLYHGGKLIAGFVLLDFLLRHAAPLGTAWLAIASASAVSIAQLLHTRATHVWGESASERFRWILLLAASLWATRTLISPCAVGAGDSYWYATTLGDFVSQLRAGQFPVWVGQSIYAFNGAVFPLRLAPMFQHAGGVLDLISFHTLGITALKNALLVQTAVAAIASAYCFLRLILPRHAWISAILAILWLWGPGQLAPLLVGDQYMTYMTLPFLPPFLYGCWRISTCNDRKGRIALVVGLAGLWLSHTPIAIWCSFIATGFWTTRIIFDFNVGPQFFRATRAAAMLFILGGWPVVSAIALHTTPDPAMRGSDAVIQIGRVFPANFYPIDTAVGGLSTYQLGYSVLGLFLFTVILYLRRPRGAVAGFYVTSLAIAPFTIPIGEITRFLWVHLPHSIVAINNIWPMQRLFLIWSSVIIFGFASALHNNRLSRLNRFLLFTTLALGLGWTGHEMEALVGLSRKTRSTLASTEMHETPQNLQVVRYAYGGLGPIPAYTSHAYMNPALENRLFARDTGDLLAANSEIAAPRVFDLSGFPIVQGRAVAAGRLMAENDNGTGFYKLVPALHIEPGQNYALRFDFDQPGMEGVLQIFGSDLFREYILPDSGAGLDRTGETQSFGSAPTSSNVISLYTNRPAGSTLRATFIQPYKTTDKYVFSNFWLYRFTPEDLPIVVDSWIPYRCHLEAVRNAWLETPRVWLDGWKATVNGQPAAVSRSPQNLVMVPVPPGKSRVEVFFSPHWWIKVTYWLCLTGWIALLFWGCYRFSILQYERATAIS